MPGRAVRLAGHVVGAVTNRIQLVLAARSVCKVASRVVARIAIQVARLHSCWQRANKSVSYKSVYVVDLLATVFPAGLMQSDMKATMTVGW